MDVVNMRSTQILTFLERYFDLIDLIASAPNRLLRLRIAKGEASVLGQADVDVAYALRLRERED